MAATISEILHLFGQGNLSFIREKSGKSQGILKTDLCGNHVIVNPRGTKRRKAFQGDRRILHNAVYLELSTDRYKLIVIILNMTDLRRSPTCKL